MGSDKMLQISILTMRKAEYLISLLASLCLLLSLVQVNDCETESSLCSAILSHAAPSSQGMAKVQDGHTNACDRYMVLCETLRLLYFKNTRVIHILYLWLCLCVCVLYSFAMLEESQDGMDSGTLSPASARQVTIQRHPTQGFGFIAGSQRPVIVRSVSAG